jgi:TonB-dependent receptor
MRKIILLLSFFLIFIFTQGHAQSLLKLSITDEQRLSLPGATILIDNTPTTVSNEWGIAYVYNISKGVHSLKIVYMGYQNYEKNISIEADTELTLQLQPGVETLHGILVLGDRLKGQAKALNEQKNEGNISNIISSDQIGRFPDANLGDAIKRVPGIAMQNDQGEARNIIIRGLSPDFVNVSLNGVRIPSAEGDNRRVQMDLIPADMVQLVEVNKTLLPEMDGDAIGGLLNLVTRTAPKKFRFSATASGGYNVIREKGYANIASVIGGRIWKNKLGIVANMTMTRNVYGSDDIEAAWEKDDYKNVYITEQEVRVYDENRLRRSYGATIDYKINTKNTIYLNGLYNWRSDRENRYRLRYKDIEPEYDDEGNITSYTGEIQRQTKGGIQNNKVKSRRLEDQKVRNFGGRGEHILGKNLKLTWSSSYAKASEERPNERYLLYRVKDEPLHIDLSDPDKPFALPINTLQPSDFKLNELTEQYSYTDETDWNSKLNLQIPVNIIAQQKGNIKLGVRYSDKDKERHGNFFEYSPINEMEAAMETMNLIPLVERTDDNYQPGSKYKAGFFGDARYLGELNLSNPDQFEAEDKKDEYYTQNYHAKEHITAGYVQLSHAINSSLSFIAGVRIEHTSLEYTGNIFDAEEEESKGSTTLDSSYTTILPSINLKYAFNKNTLLRAAWATSIARPRYYDLVPYNYLDVPENELASGNSSLKPTYAHNFDIMFEHYFSTVGIVSAGAFYKHLNDFGYTRIINNFTREDYQRIFNPPANENPIPEGEKFEYTRPENGDAVNLFGFEVALQRQFDFLPGFWKGFGIYANYTYTHSNAKGVTTLDGEEREDVALPGTVPHIWNASLSYENKKFVARLSAHYTASYIDELGENSFYDRYYDKQFFLDFNTSYSFTPSLRIFMEINNITNQPLRYYQGFSHHTMQEEYYRMKWNIGVKYDIF